MELEIFFEQQILNKLIQDNNLKIKLIKSKNKRKIMGQELLGKLIIL